MFSTLVRDSRIHIAEKSIRLILLPQTPYQEVWDLQRSIFSRIIEGREQDTLIMCQHPPVYTLGRATDSANVLFSDEELRNIGAEKFLVERGGDVTFHGPGQLVGYPLLNLSHFHEDLGWYLRSLEETIILTLQDFGVHGLRIAGRTGVWVGSSGHEEKICAIGIKVSKWCTMHGFAFNINTDLSYFNRIIPCGIGDKNVTSLSKILQREISIDDVRSKYLTHFETVFGVRTGN